MVAYWKPQNCTLVQYMNYVLIKLRFKKYYPEVCLTVTTLLGPYSDEIHPRCSFGAAKNPNAIRSFIHSKFTVFSMCRTRPPCQKQNTSSPRVTQHNSVCWIWVGPLLHAAARTGPLDPLEGRIPRASGKLFFISAPQSHQFYPQLSLFLPTPISCSCCQLWILRNFQKGLQNFQRESGSQ